MLDLWLASLMGLGNKVHLHLQPFRYVRIGKACWRITFLQSRYPHLWQGDDAHMAHGVCRLTSVAWCRETWVVPEPEVVSCWHAV